MQNGIDFDIAIFMPKVFGIFFAIAKFVPKSLAYFLLLQFLCQLCVNFMLKFWQGFCNYKKYARV